MMQSVPSVGVDYLAVDRTFQSVDRTLGILLCVYSTITSMMTEESTGEEDCEVWTVHTEYSSVDSAIKHVMNEESMGGER